MNFRRVSLCFFAIQCLAFAQDRGSISGTITDTSGAVVPGAKVALQNPSTNLSRAVDSGSGGAYTFVNLPAGDYKVTVTKEGFRSVETPACMWT